MGYLAAAGAYLIIGLVVSFILMVVGLFIGHIIVFDSIALGIISGVCCNHFFTLHPALCVLIGAAVFALLLFLQKTRFVIGYLHLYHQHGSYPGTILVNPKEQNPAGYY